MRRYPLNCRTHLPRRRCASKAVSGSEWQCRDPAEDEPHRQTNSVSLVSITLQAHSHSRALHDPPASDKASPTGRNGIPSFRTKVTQAKGGRYKVFPLAPLQLGWLEPGNKREPRPRFLASFDQFRTSPPCSTFFCACRLSAYLGPELARTTRTRGLVLASITPA